MILQLITNPDRRGAQVFAVDLERALTARGLAVETVALGPGNPDGLSVEVLGPSRLHPKTLRALSKRARRAEVIVGHGSTTLYAGAVAAAATRRPFVYRQISDSHFWAHSPARRFRVRAFLRRADAVVALWSGSAAALASDFGVPQTRLTVIPNGVPAGRVEAGAAARQQANVWRDGLDESACVAAYVGALAAEKGVADAISALPLEVDRLLVAGSGAEEARLIELADRLTPGRVRFLSSVVNVAAVYEAADFVVFPSRAGDSMPAVVIEAALTSLPVVATRTAALPEMVRHERTGLLVERGDIDGLRAAMAGLAVDPTRRKHLGAAAKRHCLAAYEIDTIAEQWADLFDRVR